MTTRSETAGKISWRQAVISILVLGTLLTVSFGGSVLKQGQRYLFLGRELYTDVLKGERYRLLKEYHFINNYHEPRRLFILEETRNLSPHNHVILTDENYETITRLEFPKSGDCNAICLMQTVNPPLLEFVSDTSHGPKCLQYTICEDHFLPFNPKRDLYQTASLAH